MSSSFRPLIVLTFGFGWFCSNLLHEIIDSTKDQSNGTVFDRRNATFQNNLDDVNGSAVNGSAVPFDGPALVPKDLRLVMLGDSITRYQYLSLAYYLRHSSWYNESRDRQNYLVFEKSFSSWNDFYSITSGVLLYPYEQCDCYRDNLNRGRNWLQHVYENRFYYDPKSNNSIAYIQAFGDVPSRARWEPSTAFSERHTTNVVESLFVGNWSTTIREYIGRLDPKPTHLVMNAGFWPHRIISQPSNIQDILQALNETGIQGIWRTTTAKQAQRHTLYQTYELDKAMCNHLPCLNTSWTSELSKDDYWDEIHFFEPVYARMNLEMLSMLK